MFLDSSSKAFSLVELSIVMIISSVMCLTAVSAKILLERSHVLKLAADLLEIHQAVQVFTEKYGSLPGDYPNASTVIRTGLPNGNGDGYIGSIAAQQNGHWEFLTDSTLNQENRSFFQHLQASELLLNFSLTTNGYALAKTIKNLAVVPRIEFSETLYEIPINTLTLVNAAELIAPAPDSTRLSSALSTEQLMTLKQQLEGSNCQQGDCLLEGQLIVRVLTTADYVGSTNLPLDNCLYNQNGILILNTRSKRKCTAFMSLDEPIKITADVHGNVSD